MENDPDKARLPLVDAETAVFSWHPKNYALSRLPPTTDHYDIVSPTRQHGLSSN